MVKPEEIAPKSAEKSNLSKNTFVVGQSDHGQQGEGDDGNQDTANLTGDVRPADPRHRDPGVAQQPEVRDRVHPRTNEEMEAGRKQLEARHKAPVASPNPGVKREEEDRVEKEAMAAADRAYRETWEHNKLSGRDAHFVLPSKR